MSWFILSLLALLAWSGSDLFSKMGSPPKDKHSHLKIVCAVGLVMGIHALLSITVMNGGEAYELGSMLTYLPVSGLYIISMFFGYIGLRYIELSVSSPICNSSGALVTVLCVVILKETFDFGQYIAVGLITAGIIALAVVERMQSEDLKTARRENASVKYISSFAALVFPIIYLILDAAGTFVDNIYLNEENPILSEFQANVSYELTFLILGIICAVYVFGIKREPLVKKYDRPKLIGAVCETAGQLAYVYAIAANGALAAPIIAAYCALSAVWAHMFLKEKLSKWHYVCLAFVFAGILIMGIIEGLEADISEELNELSVNIFKMI